MRSCEYWQVSNSCNTVFKSNRLFLIHINIRPLQQNFDDLYQLIFSFAKSPDIICISKTQLKVESIMKMNRTGYNFIDAKTSTNADGKRIYIANSLTFSINEKLYIECGDCENLWITSQLVRRLS